MKEMTDLELELRILQKYTEHHDAVGTHAHKCARELDMKEVISNITGQPVEEAVFQRWHARLAPPSHHAPGLLRPCSISTVNTGPHRFHARAYFDSGKAPAWERISELETLLPGSQVARQQFTSGGQGFVSESRIAQIRALAPTAFDLCKLARLCEELNIVYSGGALLATAMLTRAILDHVPPLFGMATFTEVANNYSGTRSFKETMKRLEEAARKIADGHLHGQIRTKETLPEPQQVNFAAEVDVLLAEIVRTLT
jgi:hypothetical protein